VIVKNFHNSLSSLDNQYSVHNSLLHLHFNFQYAITPHLHQIDNERTFQLQRPLFSSNSARTLTHYIFAIKCGQLSFFQFSFKTSRECEARMSRGNLFQATGPEYIKARCPSLVRSLGKQ